MNILYDLISTQPLGKTKYHGGGEFSKRIFLSLVEKNTDSNIYALYDKRKELSIDIIDCCKKNNIKLIAIENKNEFIKLINNQKFDKFFIPLYNSFYTCEIPKEIFVFYCHLDMRQTELPIDDTIYYYESGLKSEIRRIFPFIAKLKHKITKTNYQKKYMDMIRRANQLITASTYSKYAIMQSYPELDSKSIKICYCPMKKIEMANYNPNGLGKYFLLISCNRYEKNAYRAIRALDEIMSDFPEYKFKVVCCGKTPKKVMDAVLNKKRFIFKDYVESDELSSLYKNAYAFLFPSIYEGFGYPPLEAMKLGTPVLSSNVTSMPEICGSAVIYFNPFSIEEIKNRILYSLNEDIREYSARGVERYKAILAKQNNDLDDLICKILKEK